jgi:hypothetical protein
MVADAAGYDGPYFQPVAWSATQRSFQAIVRALASESPDVTRSLLIDCAANRVELPEVNERLLAVDPKDSALCLALLDTLVRRQELSDAQIAAAQRSCSRLTRSRRSREDGAGDDLGVGS